MDENQVSGKNNENNSTGFNSWLIEQLGRSDTVGVFSRSVTEDDCWPTRLLEGDYVTFRNHLRAHVFDDTYVSRITAFEIAWEEYQVSVIAKASLQKATELTMLARQGNASS